MLVVSMAGLVTGLQTVPARAAEPNTEVDTNTIKLSDAGTFKVEVISQLQPIAINTMHQWVLKLSMPDDEVVPNAEISVSGGMPAHNHGLPTAPRVTRELAAGEYLVEGLKFQMPGHWEVTFVIKASDMEDSVTFNLKL